MSQFFVKFHTRNERICVDLIMLWHFFGVVQVLRKESAIVVWNQIQTEHKSAFPLAIQVDNKGDWRMLSWCSRPRGDLGKQIYNDLKLKSWEQSWQKVPEKRKRISESRGNQIRDSYWTVIGLIWNLGGVLEAQD